MAWAAAVAGVPNNFVLTTSHSSNSNSNGPWSASTSGASRYRLMTNEGKNGLPFLTTPGELVGAVQGAIRAETGIDTELSTTGGTSDGRFISRICPQVVEFGPVNASIHKIDEHVRVADIDPLKNIYRRTIENLDALR